MKQFDLFEVQQEQRLRSRQECMFQKWASLPPEHTVPAGSPERPLVRQELADGYGMVWEYALHRCQWLPPDHYIWLNHIEAPEYWVMNQGDDPCGEHVEVCPFCGADLRHGEGDVILMKADDGWWRILKRIKSDEK